MTMVACGRPKAPTRNVMTACVAMAAVLTGGATPVAGQGQAYPAKPIRLVVPFAAGGVTDTPWRIVSAKLAEDFGGQVLIENRPGAGASIGAAIVAAAPADGYTLLGTSSSHVMTGVTFKALPYDTLGDFVYVAQIAESCQALVVHPSFPVRSVAQLIALAKAQPGKLDYSTSGTGTAPHLYHELFMSIAGIRMNHIPYKGITQQVPDLIAGRVPQMFIGVTVLLPFLEAKRLIPIAVSCGKRDPLLPLVPTMNESGVRGFEATLRAGLLAPRGLSPEIGQKLETALQRIMARPDVRKGLQQVALTATFDTGKNFDAKMKVEHATWGKLVKDLNIQAE